MKDEILSDFSAPWCQSLLNSPSHNRLEFDNRCEPNQPANNRVVTNTLLSKAWKTESTLRAMVGLEAKEVEPPNITPEIIILYSLGTDLGGYRNIAHGGVMMALLDQTMGNCAVHNYGLTAMTLDVKMGFKRSLRLPGVALTRAVAVKRDGPRIYIKGTLENDKREVLLEAEAVFYVRRPGSL